MRYSSELDFIIIGGTKCGTSTISKMLGEHRSINIEYNDVHVFSGNSTPSCSKELNAEIYGEKSARYLYSKDSLLRIKCETKNQIKLIVCLRDPVYRFISHYNHSLKMGLESRSLLEVVQEGCHSNYYLRSAYYKFIVVLFEIFDKNQVHVCYFEDMITNTQNFFDEICDFLEADKIEVHLKHYNRTYIFRSSLIESIYAKLFGARYRDRLGKYIPTLFRDLNYNEDTINSIQELLQMESEKLKMDFGFNHSKWI